MVVDRWPICVGLLLILMGCVAPAMRNSEVSEVKGESTDMMALPTPVREGRLSLEETLERRRSVRAFTGEALTERELSQLVWALQGITHPAGSSSAATCRPADSCASD